MKEEQPLRFQWLKETMSTWQLTLREARQILGAISGEYSIMRHMMNLES
jgi:hypothetical protein